jgi:hypothetical protein
MTLLGAPAEVTLFGGQSNTVAAWNVNPTGTHCGKDDARIMAWNATDGAWQQADCDNPGGIGRACGQLAASFAWESVNAGRVATHGFVGIPVGGQAQSYFLPGNPSDNYADTLARVTACGRPVSRIVWWQGESDDGVAEATHLAGLETLYAAWMSDYGSVPVFIVRPWTGACGNDMTGVRAAIASFAAAHSNVTMVDADAYANDGCHCPWTGGYETAGQDLYAAVTA